MSDPLLQAMQARWGEQQTETTPPDGPENESYVGLDDELKKEAIREKYIKNETSIKNLILRKMAQAIIEEMGHSIQTSLVDFARRESPVIAALLGIPHLERDLEKLLSDKIHIAIESVKTTSIKLASDRLFE